MPESKSATARFSADKPIGSDLAKVDAHIVQPEEYDELPELTDAWFEGADRHEGGVLTHAAPRSANRDTTKRQVTLRLDADVIERFRASGPGWHGRVNAILRRALG
jgi:uncharacterized protein (DUF4415 family)